MRMCTSPRDGAPGASHSLTPTAVTAFLLDLWPRPSTAVAWLNSQDVVKVANTGLRKALCRQSLPDGLLPGSWGLSYVEIVDALGAYTPCDTRFTHS